MLILQHNQKTKIMDEFLCNWDSSVFKFTIIASIVALLSPALTILYNRYKKINIKDKSQYKINVGISCLPLLVFVLAFGVPLKVTVSNNGVYVKQPAGVVEIDMLKINDVSPLTYKDIENSERTAASGGLFGYNGDYSNQKIGNYRMIAASLENLILIRTNDENYVISCTNAEQCVASIRNKIKPE